MFLLSVESAPFEWVGLKCGSGHRRAGEDTRPYGVSGNAYRGRSQTGRGRPHGAAPTVENGTGALARKRQARERNRTSSNFPPTQAPSGAGRDRTQALLILRAGRILPTSRGNPRNRGPGKGDYEHEVLIWSRPRGRFGSFAAMGKGTRRPQAAKFLLRPLNKQAAGAHPRVASLGLRPIHLQPPPYGIARNEFNPGNEAPFPAGRNSAKRRAESWPRPASLAPAGQFTFSRPTK